MTKDRAKGVGGWLALLVVVIGVLLPLAQLGGIFRLLNADAVLGAATADDWPAFRALLVGTMVTRAAICLVVAWQLVYVKQPPTPRRAIIGIWIALCLLNVVSLTIGGIYSPGPYPVGAAIAGLFWPLVICVLATVYLLKSKRVANTYATRSDNDDLATIFD